MVEFIIITNVYDKKLFHGYIYTVISNRVMWDKIYDIVRFLQRKFPKNTHQKCRTWDIENFRKQIHVN